MTLTELLTTLQNAGAIPASRVKDCKTSLGYLAAALGQGRPDQAAVDTACQDLETWLQALETHFTALTVQGRTISAVTQRNTRSNLRLVFRLADTHGLLPTALPSRLLARPTEADFQRQKRGTTPYKSTYNQETQKPYHLPHTQWPPDIVQGWLEYKTRGALRLRETTFEGYQDLMEAYLGYLTHIRGLTPTWDTLFDVPHVTAFLRWHGGRLQRALTMRGWHLAMMLAAMANVIEHPARQALAALRRGLKQPPPLHIKRHHMVRLSLLEEVADACMTEGRLPLVNQPSGQYPGSRRAVRFGMGLMLKLLVRVPLRQRNLREMQLDRNLFQDPQTGHWVLEFVGDQLKIGTRGQQANVYSVNLTNYCPEWLPYLTEWLAAHRPKLPNAATSPYVFLTQYGSPYTKGKLGGEISKTVMRRTGQRFYPHLIRTVFTTEYLDANHGDYRGAATMLGDMPATVMKAYDEPEKMEHFAKAKSFLGKALRTG